MKILVLEGPTIAEATGRKVMHGWRNYMVLRRKAWPDFMSSTFVGTPTKARFTAEKLGAKFFEAGTWESPDSPAVAGAFPCPSRAVLDEFLGDGKEVVA